MLSSIGPLLTLFALGNLSLSNMPQCAPEQHRSIVIGLCGAPGSIEIPLDGSAPKPKSDCATACHALCARKKLAACEED
ncbi:MAG: hypothetical protein V4472_02460 [Pseudomonadota bacterium]